MYIPAHFSENDQEEISRIVEQFPLATCVSMVDGEFVINHFPVIWEGDLLIGHIAKSNPLHEIVTIDQKAAFVFRAENAYISPNWYLSKPETHRFVPTWNYQVVHMHGELNFDYSKKAKISIVGKLTKIHERRLFGENAWKMSDAPKEYMDNMIDNIVAFNFKISKIDAKSKLSQNREKRDYDNVAKAMEESNFMDLAARMKKLSDRS